MAVGARLEIRNLVFEDCEVEGIVLDLGMAKIVILTGAGISAESGVKTFRDDGGLWEGHRVEDVATPEAFERDPALVHQFYNCLLYTSPSPRDQRGSRMPSSA